jgi:hypothetical protein
MRWTGSDEQIGIAMAIGFIIVLLVTMAAYLALSTGAPRSHADTGCVSERCFARGVADGHREVTVG